MTVITNDLLPGNGQEVVGIRNTFVENIPPQDGYALVFDAASGNYIPKGVVLAGGGVTLTGDVTGPATSNALTTTGVSANTYGDSTHVGQFTVDAKGRISTAANISITGAAPTGPAGGDLSGTYPNPQVAQVQGNAVEAVDYSSAQDGYVMTWSAADDKWEAKIPGSGGLIPLATPPVVPIAGDNYFGMFVWHFASDTSDDILFSDGYMQSLINFCGSKGVNIIFLGVEPYLSPTYYTLAREQALNKFLHTLHASRIEVHALMGQGSNGDGYSRNPGTGSNFIGYGQAQQWYLQNIVEPVRQYNIRAPSSKYPNSKFDGFLTDSEYYNNGPSFYTTVEAEGNISNINITKSLLPDIKCGITVNWTQMPAANCYLYRGGDGYWGTEGCHMINAPGCDYIVVQAYRNSSAAQIPLFDPFYLATNNSTVVAPKIRTNVPLFLASSCESDITASHSYYTGAPGGLATMLAQLAITSANYGGYSAPIIWQGHVIEEYFDTFSTMT